MTSYRGNASVGSHVFTADGEDIGTVMQIAGTCFKVEAQQHVPFWLGADTVANMSGAGIRITLSQEDMNHPDFDQMPHRGRHLHN